MPLQLHKIASVEVTSPASSIEFASIPQGYTDLKLVVTSRCSVGGNWADFTTKFNSSTTGYSQKYLYGTGSAVSTNTGGYSSGYAGHSTGTGTTANTFSNVEVYIPNYASSKAKSFSFDSVTENNATGALSMIGASLWSGTGAITNILVEQQGGFFTAYTTATLYGIL